MTKKRNKMSKNKNQQNKNNDKETISRKVLVTFLGIVFFIFIAVIIFSFIFYFAYLFKEKFISALFKIILIGMGLTMYYVLITELIKGRSL
jgi:Fe2+ transport system protein B